jgi:NIPSNAP
MRKHITGLFMVAVVAAVGWAGYAAHEAQGGKSVEPRVFEMRTYYAAPGKMDALHARFRDHTNKLFVKHGMTLIGYWSPIDAKDAEQKMIYILAYPSKEAATQSWKDFQDDPAWKTAKAASEKDGKLVAKVESIYLKATDYSPIK